jgi:anti-sigma factor RsiW
MTGPTPHLGDEIQELVDGRLDPAREAEVRAHLDACEICRDEWQRFVWLKRRLRNLAATAEGAGGQGSLGDRAAAGELGGLGEREELGDLRAAVRASLDREPRPEPRPGPWQRRWIAAAGIAAMLAMAFAGGGAWWWLRPPSPAEIAADYLALRSGALRVDYTSADTHALERHFVTRGGVPSAVYDLGPQHYTLTGGRVQAHRRHAGTIALYRDAHGRDVICEMYTASPPAGVLLRSPIDRRIHNGRTFVVYQHGDVTMVFWREGAVTCVLAGMMNPEALLQLAFAKTDRSS